MNTSNNYRLHFGDPKNNKYNTILDLLSHAKINSFRTSTIPLAQYWKKTDEGLATLAKLLNVKLDHADLMFECPTPSYENNRSSMTDLMIQSGEYKIAIEAKYTEYHKIKPEVETVKYWLGNHPSENKT